MFNDALQSLYGYDGQVAGNGLFCDTPELPDAGNGLFCDTPELPDAGNGLFCDTPELPDAGNGLFCDTPEFPDAGNGLFCDTPEFPDAGNGLFCDTPEFPDAGGRSSYLWMFKLALAVTWLPPTNVGRVTEPTDEVLLATVILSPAFSWTITSP
ncbi:hypothetical protein KDH_40530 [Dictyobacter sp. S3.2.2.5]|uniref:Uncharacterized protein n=1 Tax=Dictyobacter halimunensis TaxID=3026934 RepID=A0ABQ6FSH1_9CHLR|nr:hypothetical protein KDH_40530 [Dictyobacter sp. S3.2.2.5]